MFKERCVREEESLIGRGRNDRKRRELKEKKRVQNR